MDTVWKALEAIGNLLLGAGTFFVGLAAVIKTAKPKAKKKTKGRKSK